MWRVVVVAETGGAAVVAAALEESCCWMEPPHLRSPLERITPSLSEAAGQAGLEHSSRDSTATTPALSGLECRRVRVVVAAEVETHSRLRERVEIRVAQAAVAAAVIQALLRPERLALPGKATAAG